MPRLTCDTSRVATTLTKQRLMTTSYDYYELRYPQEGLRGEFIYKTIPKVSLKTVANNPEIDEIFERLHPAIELALKEGGFKFQVPVHSPLRLCRSLRNIVDKHAR